MPRATTSAHLIAVDQQLFTKHDICRELPKNKQCLDKPALHPTDQDFIWKLQ